MRVRVYVYSCWCYSVVDCVVVPAAASDVSAATLKPKPARKPIDPAGRRGVRKRFYGAWNKSFRYSLTSRGEAACGVLPYYTRTSRRRARWRRRRRGRNSRSIRSPPNVCKKVCLGLIKHGSRVREHGYGGGGARRGGVGKGGRSKAVRDELFKDLRVIVGRPALVHPVVGHTGDMCHYTMTTIIIIIILIIIVPRDIFFVIRYFRRRAAVWFIRYNILYKYCIINMIII